MPTMPARRGYQTPGELIAGRYKVIDTAGRGNFARVVRAKDTQTGEVVAVKILSQEYARDAQFELEVLQSIAKNDPDNKFKVCKLRSNFKIGGETYFVFDLLGNSLKQNRGRGASRSTLQAMTKQLGRALQYMHFECRMVHTDLKPENILVDRPDLRTGLGDAWTIVDLGSASFYSEKPDMDLISTRPYRAPEVLVGAGWSFAADMWSFGCILYEMATGRVLFDVSSDAQHLALIERRVGAVPRWLADSADPKARHMFDHEGRLRTGAGMGVTQSFSQEFPDDPHFADLLRRLLTYDPVLRCRADEVVHHPYVKGADAVPAETGILNRIPPNAYTSGRIKCPGINQKRFSLSVPLPEEVPQQQPRAAPHGHVHAHAHGPRAVPGTTPVDPRFDVYGRMAPGHEHMLPQGRKLMGAAAVPDLYRELEKDMARMHVGGAPVLQGYPGAPRGAPQMPMHHRALPPNGPPAHVPGANRGLPAPSRAVFVAEESMRALGSADAALYRQHPVFTDRAGVGARAGVVPPAHHHRRY